MSSNYTPDYLLRHLQYLRNLHLEGPRLGNIYLEDSALRQYTSHLIGNNESFQKQLQRLGDRFANQYLKAARNAQENPPRLEQFDSYGRRIDKLHLSEGWKQIAKMSAEDGIVAMAYEKNDKHNLKQLQRFGQLICLYMYHPSSGLFGCPLAMTDGAAYTLLHIFEGSGEKRAVLTDAFNRLTARKDMWTSGQWMTEKKGGSDVSNTETIAVKDSNSDTYKLYGYKWFTSATDSHMSLGLAKILPPGVQPTQEALKTVKVSLFFIKMRNQQGQLNRMEMIRLKDKLGTRQLPTAELLLKGSEAHLISGQEQGVKYISKMLTVTRLYNSATAVGVMRRIIALARDYSQRRTIGKMPLSKMPLQLRVLSYMEVTHRANLMFYLKISELFSKQHAKIINEDEANLLRVMTPLLKLFTAKQVLQVCTEGLQAFGGMGYIEGTMLPNALRDAQVLSIWEGTTNVLCYDFVRALIKTQNSVQPMNSLIKFAVETFQRIAEKEVRDKKFIYSNELLVFSYNGLIKDLTSAIENKFQRFNKRETTNANPMAELRNLCMATARVFTALLLQNHVLLTARANDIEISNRWIERGLYKRENYDPSKDRALAMDLDGQGNERGGGDIDARGVLRGRL